MRLEMRIFHIVLIGILLLSICFAENDVESFEFYPYKIGDVVDLKVACILNGQACTSGSTCNISLNYPNGSIEVSNQAMTNNNAGQMNYTMADSSVLGKHTGYVNCIDGTATYKRSILITVPINNSGTSDSNLIYVALILLGLFFIFSIVMTFFSRSTDSALFYLFIILDFLIPTLICWFAYLYPPNIIEPVADMFMVMGFIFAFLTFVSFILVLLELTLMWIAMAAQKKQESWTRIY